MSIKNNCDKTGPTVFYWRGCFDPNFLLTVDERVQQAVSNLLNNEHRSCDLEKLKNSRVYSLKLNDADRLLFSDVEDHTGKKSLLLLEVVLNHDYQKARFLKSHVFRDFHNKIQGSLEESIDLKNIILEKVTSEEKTHISGLLKGISSYSPMDYYQSKFIKLNDQQGNVIKAQLPLVVIGAPGSGKSCVALSCLVEFLKDNNHEGKKLLYVCSSQNLAYVMESGWNKLPIAVECKAEVTFTSYEKLVEKEFSDLKNYQKISLEEMSGWFKTQLQKIKKKPQFKGQVIGINKSHEKSVFEEFQVVSTCSEEKYLTLGRRQSLYSKKNDKELMCTLFRSYQNWLKDRKKIDLRFETSKCETKYHFCVVDEAADLSPLELLQLYNMSIDGRVVYFVDSNQDLHDQFTKEILLKNVMENHEIPYHTVNLPTVYRCPRQVVELANHVLGLKAAIFGGLLGKETYRKIEIQQESSIGDGNVSCCHGDFKKHYASLVEMYSEVDIAIIIEKSKKCELIELGIKKSMLFTPEEIKGLEFKSVVLYEPLASPVFKEINKALTDVQKEDLDLNLYRSKDEVDFTSNTETIPELNKLFTSITRSQESLLIFQKVEHQVEKLYELLIDEKWVQQVEKKTTGEAVKTSSRDWLCKAKMYYENGHIVKFNEVCQELGLNPEDVLIQLYASDKAGERLSSDSLLSVSSGSSSESSPNMRKSKTKKKKKKKIQQKEVPPQDHTPVIKSGCLSKESEKVSIPPSSPIQKKSNSKKINIINDFFRIVSKGSSEAKVKEFMQRKSREELLFRVKDENDETLFDRIQQLPNGDEVVSQIRDQVESHDAEIRGEAYLYCLYYGRADINDPDFNNNRALHFAAECGNLALVQNLVKAGADVNCVANDGFTPLHNAAMNNHDEIIRFLVMNGARVNVKTKEEKITPLMLVAYKGSLEQVRFLVDKGAHIQVVTAQRQPPINFAVRRGDLKIVKYFIEKNALRKKKEVIKNGKRLEVKERGDGVVSPLIPAVIKGHGEIVDYLLEAGVKVNVKEAETGMTPLHVAAKYGHEAIVQKLMQAGAELTIRDKKGLTPLQIAHLHKHEKIIALLSGTKKEVDARDNGESSGSNFNVSVEFKKRRKF